MPHPVPSNYSTPIRSITPTIDIYIKLAQYPTLAHEIRVRMRDELFQRGIIEEEVLNAEVKEKALESQRREGLFDPFGQEQAHIWQKRKDRIRDFQTDAYFGNNLSITLLDGIIEEVLNSQPGHSDSIELNFNPEIAPWEMLFRQGELYENLPPDQLKKVKHHLLEIKVVLIKGMISDQLRFIAVAKHVFSIDDLRRIYRRRIGGGKIGGKAAGMILAWKILQQKSTDGSPDISEFVEIPDSYFLGSEVIYDFRLMNNLERYMNQKYRPLDEIREEHPKIEEDHLAGTFPPHIVQRLNDMLDEFGDDPIIVRSSSLLEDNFGYSFAGKYSSYFCPNQGTKEKNLKDLLDAIRRVYASTINPDAILYRQHHGLIDYDERMAVLLQRVRGKRYGRYFFPTIAGVGFSRNPFRWHPKIDRNAGFLRIVWGMGTRAVDRVSNDYPRMISLSHPRLRPESTPAAQRQYAQWFIDLVDLEKNKFNSLPIEEVLGLDYPGLRYIASQDKGEYLQRIVSVGGLDEHDRFVLTFEALVRDRKFVTLMRTALANLEKGYKTPVDIEFTVEVLPGRPYPEFKLHLLQCRPLSQRKNEELVTLPTGVPEQRILFTSRGLIPNGRAEQVRYIIFVNPETYREIPDNATKLELGRAIGRLNKLLEEESFILIGPGRWGSTNLELGVRVTYADIYNTKVLIELGVAQDGKPPELSYGTHFFQDLVESGIFSLPIPLHEKGASFNWRFFRLAPNSLATLLPEDEGLSDYLQVIDLLQLTNGFRLNVLMDGTNNDEAIGHLVESTQNDQIVANDQSSLGYPFIV
ncbi:PEP/pyruvate-binding domain-containing protein [Candidatus Leptofilum sp.]|uniref:PEP/pyruvate-binding domain-containing protein n=1 Tax=Candidatus Leptofilum sp. TaxID=3241576 RepID=UPI003B595741